MSKRLVVLGVLSLLALVLAGCWPMPNRISVSPDGNLLALSVSPAADGLYEAFPSASQIWVLGRATGDLSHVIADGEALLWATWSPDGQALLYVTSEGWQEIAGLEKAVAARWRLMLFTLATGERQQLLEDNESFPWGISFSPDGQKIAYYRASAEGQIAIVVFDRATREAKVLRTAQAGHQLSYAPYGPTLLWLGHQLVLVRVESILPSEDLPETVQTTAVRVVRGKIVRLDLECVCEEELARGYYPLLPTPLYIIGDGRKLYLNGYASTFSLDPAEPVRLYEVDIEERQSVVLYDGEGIALAPALSPDGTGLLFTVLQRSADDTSLKVNLYLRNFQTLAPASKLIEDERAGFGFWLSNDEIGFLRRVNGAKPAGELWSKNLTTGEERNWTALLAGQKNVAQLSVQLAAAQQETQRYQAELTKTQAALEELQKKLDALNEALQKLSGEIQSQSQQSVEPLNQKLVDVVQQINALGRTMGDLKKQVEDLDGKLVALEKRPALDFWPILISVLLGAILVIWMIRRSLRTLAQQLAFPPQ